MRYLPPFDTIIRGFDVSPRKGEKVVTATYEAFLAALRRLIADINLDEGWYLARYEDVATAVKDGKFTSAKQHYIANGFIEGRMPFPTQVDERWYLQQNPDVAEYIRKGTIASAQEHFDQNGYREGRRPFNLST